MTCRGVRGAITVASNTREDILGATRLLLAEMVTANGIAMDDVASVIFTATADLDAVYPAVAARELGWTQTPLLCMQEMAVRGSLDHCVRVLIHWNTPRAGSEIQHIYLRGARALRPDLVEGKA
ncbi:MAG: chorismate mutase [Anaerolineae bacterium]|nr:chorismate mutase [Anaerolineae bacterium]